jgi:hypothetical protein
MKTKKCLTCDINRRIDMSNASRQPYPKGRAAQLGPHPSAAVSALAGGCPAIGPEMLHLRAPGLSLPRAGTTTQAPSPGRRCQSVLHYQAFAPSRTATPRLRCFDRIDLKRDRQPCLLGGTAPRGRSWLSRRAVSHEPSIWNIASTDYCRTSWFRPTTCSHRTGTGRLLQARSPQAARRW